MKKLFCLLICAVLLVPMLVACGNNGNSGEAVSPLPEGSKVPEGTTFEGESYTILCREDNAYGIFEYEITADEGETEIVNQAVYERNRNVMDIFGLTEINAHAIPGDWANAGDFVNTFRNSIDAGLGDFDLIVSQEAYLAEAELAQYFYDFNDVPYVKDSLEHEYYYSSAVNELTINGQLKYMVGDFCLTYWDHAYVMYFNKLLAENFQLENIYDLVRNNQWTIDKCLEMARGKYRDDNNDLWKGSEDTYGYISDTPCTTDAWHSQFDVQPTKRDENGQVIIDLDVNKMTSILTKMIEFKNTNDAYYAYTTSGDTMDENPLDLIFRESRALFYPAILRKAQDFRSMEVDFGIVPYPKWDENQTGYYTTSQDGYSAVCVPADAKNLEKVGAVFDTLSAISKEKVIPAYYDEALTYKYTRDEDSAEMLDIIREGFIVNFGMFYSQAIGNTNIFRNLVDNDNPNFASYYAANKAGYDRKLRMLLETYQDND